MIQNANFLGIDRGDCSGNVAIIMNALEMHFNMLFNPFPIFTIAEATEARAGAASAANVALAWVVAKAGAALALVEAL